MFWCTVQVLGIERLHQIVQTTHGSFRDMNSSVCFISAITAQLSVVESEFLFLSYNCLGRWPGSVVGIATGYGLDGPGIESQCGRDLPHLSRPPHPASCKLVTGSLPGVKSGKGMTLTPQPLLVPWSRKSRAIPSTPPMGRTACTEPPCLYKGAIYLTVW